MEAGSIRLKKDSVKTYILIQFAGPRQYFFYSDLKYLTKICDIKCITGPKLIKNILSFVLTLVPRTLEIAF